jgi:glycosyltransferase involved in cell wall biosynthesis
MLDLSRPALATAPVRDLIRGYIHRAVHLVAPHLGVSLVGAALSLTASDSRHAVVRGWLDPGRLHSQLTGLAVAVDDQLVHEVAIAALGPGWPQPAPGRAEWALEVDAAPWSRVEVFARASSQLMSLGVLIRPPVGRDSIAARPDDAALDLPAPGTEVNFAACLVSGWAILDGQAPDRVEAFVDADPPRPIRRGLPRRDLPGAAGQAYGFESVIPLGNHQPGDEVTVVVRATGTAGTVWHSDPVQVRFAPTYSLETPQRPATVAMSTRPVRTPDASGKLRAVVFTHSLRLGGGQLHLQHMARQMMAANEIELVVVSPEDGVLRHELETAGIGVHITRGYTVDPAAYPAQITEFAALIQALGADVVVANTLGVFAAIDAAHHAGVPVAWVIHESFELPIFEYLNWGPSGLHPSIRDRLYSTLREADAVVFETPSTLSMYADAIPEINAVLVRYGVDAGAIHDYIEHTDRVELRAAAGYRPNDIVFVCMGVFEPRKATLALADAFAEATEHRDDVRLALIGAHPAPYCDAVEEFLDTRQLRDRVQSVPIHADIYRWYRLADVIISASDIESMPRSLLEAMTFGLPVVTTDTFGTNELVQDGHNGMVCTPNSHSALVAAITRAAGLDAAQRAEMGRRSVQRVAELGGFDYDREYTQLLRRLAIRSSGGHL